MDNKRIQAVYDGTAHRIAGRLMKDVDLFEGIKEVCVHYGIQAANFQCFGSLKYATFLQLERGEGEGELRYSGKRRSTSSVELLSGTGFVGHKENGEVDVHFHGMMIDCDGQLNGGHFIEGENPVAVTVEYVIFPLHDMQLQRGPDPHWGLPVFQFTQRSEG
ncbi:PPC domain-containing DNA-binding protein [Planococcus salinus]|uniref:DNA-binding protein n=1 Tax=Planococcus salinus TaxID=1848460 RepID=A0A3M8P951_9BACL|nr:PPC domain-containing DNA-binding protein [Planococcus salinus]RNF40197.1 DNA-binding protein [Planococcus salinus]